MAHKHKYYKRNRVYNTYWVKFKDVKILSVENEASNKLLDDKQLRNWFKFEWAKKCNSKTFNEPCDVWTQIHRVAYKILTAQGSRCWYIQHGCDTSSALKKRKKHPDLFSC